MSAHAKFFQPSASHRITQCPASFRMAWGKPSVAGLDAAQGTLAHEVHAGVLESAGRRRASEWLGQKSVIDGFEVTVDAEMVDAVQESAEWCLRISGALFVETRVDISRLTPVPRQFGSLDAAVAGDGKLVITDLKYGRGVQVDAARNTQLALYALGFLTPPQWHGVRRIELRISQPRCGHFDVWVLDRGELEEFGQWIKGRFRSALLDEDPEFVVGEHCRFCPARLECPAQQQALDDLVGDAFEATDTLPEPVTLSMERLQRVLKLRPVVEAWLRAVGLRAMELAHQDALPGYKLVAARAHRKWIDEAAARQALLEKGADENALLKLISPAQVEKTIFLDLKPKARKEIVAELAAASPGKPTLAFESDERPKYRPADMSCFSSDGDDE